MNFLANFLENFLRFSFDLILNFWIENSYFGNCRRSLANILFVMSVEQFAITKLQFLGNRSRQLVWRIFSQLPLTLSNQRLQNAHYINAINMQIEIYIFGVRIQIGQNKLSLNQNYNFLVNYWKSYFYIKNVFCSLKLLLKPFLKTATLKKAF